MATCSRGASVEVAASLLELEALPQGAALDSPRAGSIVANAGQAVVVASFVIEETSFLHFELHGETHMRPLPGDSKSKSPVCGDVFTGRSRRHRRHPQ